MILLDTCTFLWLVAEQESLSAKARDLIDKNAGRLYLSAISAFEIGIKYHKKLLGLPLKPEKWVDLALEYHGINEIPVDKKIAIASTLLPFQHKDPIDRMILATAQIHKLTLLSPDDKFKLYTMVDVQW